MMEGWLGSKSWIFSPSFMRIIWDDDALEGKRIKFGDFRTGLWEENLEKWGENDDDPGAFSQSLLGC